MEIIDRNIIQYNWAVNRPFLLLKLLVILLLLAKIGKLIHNLLKFFLIHGNLLVIFSCVNLINIHFLVKKLFWNLGLQHLIHSNFIFLIKCLYRALHLCFNLILSLIHIQVPIFFHVLNTLGHIGFFINLNRFLCILSLWNFETIVEFDFFVILFLVVIFLTIKFTLLSLNTWSSRNLIN